MRDTYPKQWHVCAHFSKMELVSFLGKLSSTLMDKNRTNKYVFGGRKIRYKLGKYIGAAGFEPTAFCAQAMRSVEKSLRNADNSIVIRCIKPLKSGVVADLLLTCTWVSLWGLL